VRALRPETDPQPQRAQAARADPQGARLPLPHTNAGVHGFEVDAYWPEHRLAVELDDPHTHASRFEQDRRMDATLAAHGITTIRVTRRRLDDDPHAVTATLAQALAPAAATA
jgi:very-short-patch-repair endonuclease